MGTMETSVQIAHSSVVWRQAGGRLEAGWRQAGGRKQDDAHLSSELQNRSPLDKLEAGWRQAGGRLEAGWRQAGGRLESFASARCLVNKTNARKSRKSN